MKKKVFRERYKKAVTECKETKPKKKSKKGAK